MAVIQITGRIGSVISDYNSQWQYFYGWFDVTVWFDGHRYSQRQEFTNIQDEDDIPIFGDGVPIEFNTETKEITLI